MIDPRIALSFQAPHIDTPTETMTGLQQLSNLQNLGQMQQAQLTATNQENQQRDIQLKTLAATNRAIQGSTKNLPDGTVQIDHQGVVRSLAQGGFGAAAQQYQDAQTRRDQDLTKLTAEKLDLQDKQHGQMIEDLAQVLGASGDKRAELWKKKVQKYQSQKTDGSDQLNADQVPDDATLTTLLMTAKEGRQVIQSISAEKRAKAEESRAAAAETRSAGYFDWMTRRGQDEKVIGTQNDHPVFYDPSTKQTRVDDSTRLDFAPDKANRGLTANASATEERFRQREIDDARDQLDSIHQQRTNIGNALKVQNGKDFINPLTKKSESMEDETRAGLEEQYANVTNQGKRIMREWGGKASRGKIGANEFSDTSGAGASTGKGAAPAAKAQYNKGDTVSYKGKTYKVKAVNRDGTLQLSDQ